jgi:hypothetical protein
VLELIFTLLDIYKWVIIAAALITWVRTPAIPS